MKEGFTGERSIVLPPMTIETERQDPLVSSLYITDIGYYPHADGVSAGCPSVSMCSSTALRDRDGMR